MSPSVSRRQFTAASLASSVMAASASIATAQDATPAATPVTDGPDAAGRVAAAVDQIPALAQGYIDRTGLPGVGVGVVFQDQVIFAGGFGEREVGTGNTVDAETVFQLASVSKPLSSTVIASIVGDGEVSWDTRMVDIDPSFALSDPWVTANVTIADLFSHRSGLADHAGDLLEDLGGNREEILHRLRYLEPEYPFRAGYAYTNFGLTAAAVAAAGAVGQSFEDLADDVLFGPLGMNDSSFRFSDYASRENRALLHVQQDGEWVQAFERQPDAQTPAGGASSSVRDMAQWIRLQLGQGMIDGTQVIDAGALGMTHLAHAISNMPDPPYNQVPGFYGLGWNVGYDPDGSVNLSHSGAFALGAATAVFLRPGQGLGVVVLTNGYPIGVAESLSLDFLDLALYGDIRFDYLPILGNILEAQSAPPYGDAIQVPPDDPAPPLALDAYLGSYANDFFGDLEITFEDDETLSMRLGPAGMIFPLTHFNRDVFVYTPTGENGWADSAVTFTMDPDGLASHVVVENLDIHGAGTFRRE